MRDYLEIDEACLDIARLAPSGVERQWRAVGAGVRGYAVLVSLCQLVILFLLHIHPHEIPSNE